MISVRRLMIALACACGCLVWAVMPSQAVAARAAAPSLTAATTTAGTTVTTKVRVRGGSGQALAAVLQRRVGSSWDALVSHRVVDGAATLRWTAAKPATAYRFRVILRAGTRVVVTGRSALVHTPAASQKGVVPSPTPIASAKPAPTSTTAPTVPEASPALPPTPSPTPVPDAPRSATLSMSTTHTCAIDASGQITCWGENDAGALGDGTTSDRAVPVVSAGGQHAIAVAAGDGFTCAERTDETVACWGDNASGEVPGAPSAAATAPVQVPGLDHVQGLVASHDSAYACANRSNAAPVCWGDLGTLVPGFPAKPAPPTALPGLDAGTTVESASSTRLCLRDAAGVHCTGAAPTPSAAAPGEQFPATASSVTAGELGSCAVTDDAVRCGSETNTPFTDPTGFSYPIVETPTSGTFPFPGTSSVSVSPYFACAARGAQPVVCWGARDLFLQQDYSTPRAIPGTEGVVTVRSSDLGACGQRADRSVVCWGYGELGDGSVRGVAVPVPSAVGAGLTGVSGVGGTGCGVQSGSAWCWGYAPPGSDGAQRLTEIDGTTGAVQTAITGDGACALRTDGHVVCWGIVPHDTLAPGSTSSASQTATVVPDLAGVTAITASSGHICALRGPDGAVCWGDTAHFDTSYATTGVARSVVGGTSGSTAVSTGGPNTCVIGSDAAVRCWGSDVFGVDGRPRLINPNDSTTQTSIQGGDDASALSVGAYHACLVGTSGDVRCWGDGALGAVNGTFLDPTNVATTVPGISDASAVAVGDDHSCAIVDGGHVRCWGANYYGQLGGSTTTTSIPGIDDALTITANRDATCITRSNHGLTCWGAASDVVNSTTLTWQGLPVSTGDSPAPVVVGHAPGSVR